jgi:hypothetical protein
VKSSTVRIFAVLFAISMGALLAVGCVGYRPPEVRVIDPLTPEQRLRTQLDDTWVLCRKESSGSTRFEMVIRADEVKLFANSFKEEGCPESKGYESYRLAEFRHQDFTSINSENGHARLETFAYFPSQPGIESSILTFDDSILIEADAAFVLTEGFSKLDVTLKNIKTATRDQVRGVHLGQTKLDGLELKTLNEPLKLQFQKGTSLHEVIGGVKFGGLELNNARVFDSFVELKKWVAKELGPISDLSCIEHFFTRPVLAPTPTLRGLFNDVIFSRNRKTHLELTKLGYVPAESYPLSFLSVDLVPYLGLDMVYESPKKGSSYESSGFLCRLKSRAPGLVIRK